MPDHDTDRIINDEQAFRLHIVEGLAELKASHHACSAARQADTAAIDKLKKHQNRTIGGMLVLGAAGFWTWVKQLFFGG